MAAGAGAAAGACTFGGGALAGLAAAGLTAAGVAGAAAAGAASCSSLAQARLFQFGKWLAAGSRYRSRGMAGLRLREQQLSQHPCACSRAISIFERGLPPAPLPGRGG